MMRFIALSSAVTAGLLAFAMGVMVALITLAGCNREQKAQFAGSGTFEATDVQLSAEVTGTILSLPKPEGAVVTAGDTLAVIDVEKLRLQRSEAEAAVRAATAQVDQADAALGAAREEYDNTNKRAERMRNLAERGSTSQQSLDDIETQERVAREKRGAAQAALDAARASEARALAAVALVGENIADGIIRSPIDGILLTRYVEEGELAAPGSPLVEVADLSKLKIKIYVSPADLANIRLGDTAQVHPDGMTETFPGTVTWISSEAEFTPKNVETREARADLVFAVEITVPNPDLKLKPGLPADVYFERRPE